jgi:hypothetical protein
MSGKLSVVLVGVFASVALAAGFMQGCGGGSGAPSNVGLCEQVCDKALACAPDAGATGQQAHSDCVARCQVGASVQCANASEIVSASNACLAMSCDGILTCRVPNCVTPTGAGGSNGTGGSTGTGGSSGADCSVCTKADACCSALANGTACNLVTACNAATAQQQQQAADTCQAVLAAVAGNPQAPAACR